MAPTIRRPAVMRSSSIRILAIVIATAPLAAWAQTGAPKMVEAAPASPLLVQVEAAPASPVLVQYGFDEEVPTGPDTLRVFQNAKGHVVLSNAFRFSGYSSVELRDVPGDRDFPELQGFFPKVSEGSLFLQFAMLIPDASQELNIALAGPRGFQLGRNGIALWFSTRDGFLFHTSDSIPKRLFEVEPFTWYIVDIEYRVDSGRYDLWVTREGEQPFLELRDQPNAASQPGSAVHLFSFIGDNGDDLSSVVYYVDDVLVARDRPVTLRPMVAPGRRRFFADRGAEPVRAFLRRCPDFRDLQEIGIEATTTEAFSQVDWNLLEALLTGEQPTAAGHPGLVPVNLWTQGCSALAVGRFAKAERFFSRALQAAPEATAIAFGRGLALLGRGRWDELDQLMAELSSLADDPRYGRLAALALVRTQDAEAALEWLGKPAQEALETGRATTEADAWYAVLRSAGRLAEARDYAFGLARRQLKESRVASQWYLRAGRAAFTLRDLPAAREAFEAALPGAESSSDAWLALADVAWLEGDFETERRLRETIYGRLSWGE